MNNFKEDLKYSHECEDDSCWIEIYKKAFPNVQKIISHKEDGIHQRNGIDRSIIMTNSKQILVDEKARRIKDTGDIMLEYVSNDRTQTLGWAEKALLADYIAYAFIPSGKAYMLPVLQMQAAWMKNKELWIARYGTRKAKNEYYNTLNCPVPTNELFSCIGSMLRIKFNQEQ